MNDADIPSVVRNHNHHNSILPPGVSSATELIALHQAKRRKFYAVQAEPITKSKFINRPLDKIGRHIFPRIKKTKITFTIQNPPSILPIRSYPSIEEVTHIAARYFGLSVSEILSPRRSQYVAWPRQIIMLLCKDLTKMSFPQIGRFLSRDHTTILHGVEAGIRHLKKYPDYCHAAALIYLHFEIKYGLYAIGRSVKNISVNNVHNSSKTLDTLFPDTLHTRGPLATTSPTLSSSRMPLADSPQVRDGVS